jgi:hypothetical protein
MHCWAPLAESEPPGTSPRRAGRDAAPTGAPPGCGVTYIRPWHPPGRWLGQQKWDFCWVAAALPWFREDRTGRGKGKGGRIGQQESYLAGEMAEASMMLSLVERSSWCWWGGGDGEMRCCSVEMRVAREATRSIQTPHVQWSAYRQINALLAPNSNVKLVDPC